MGDADRTPEDSRSAYTAIHDALWEYDIDAMDATQQVLAVLDRAGYAVVPRADVDAATRLRARIEQLHTPEEQEAEVWWGDADHDARFPDCPGGDFDCEGHVCTITVCSECGYTHDGETPIFRQWPCPTRAAAAVGSETPEGEPDVIRLHDCGLFHRVSEPCPTIPARPSRCPTCDSDAFRDWVKGTTTYSNGRPTFARCSDPWHSPDPDRGK